MVKIIELSQKNLRYIRKYYFKFTLEQVARASQISVSSIRNAEVGNPVSDHLLQKLFAFYNKAEKAKRALKENREAYKNVRR